MSSFQGGGQRLFCLALDIQYFTFLFHAFNVLMSSMFTNFLPGLWGVEAKRKVILSDNVHQLSEVIPKEVNNQQNMHSL